MLTNIILPRLTNKPATSPSIAEIEHSRKAAVDQQQKNSEEISVDDAASLLKLCKLRGFYYGNQTEKGGLDGDLSATGVVLKKTDDGQPSIISVAERNVATLLPVAKDARERCAENYPQIFPFHRLEFKRSDGSWR